MAVAAAVPAGAVASAGEVAPAPRRLKLLVLGGTGFIGPHQVGYALARGHEVTTFNRGRRSGMFGESVEELVGDRDARKAGGLAALAGSRTWDAVIDNSGYVPRHVGDSAGLLAGRAQRYVFISTASVYDFEKAATFDESGPLASLADRAGEQVTNETYGPLKAECERRVRLAFGDGALVIRPGYVVGPGDTSDRFTYWVERVARGGDVLGPPHRVLPLQFVDVRDLCAWTVALAEGGPSGTFNAAGPATDMSFEQALWGLAALTAEPVRFHWPDPGTMAQAGFGLPMTGDDRPYYFVSAAARQAGLAFRSLADTATATLDWWRSLPAERRAAARGWPTPEQEQALIARLG